MSKQNKETKTSKKDKVMKSGAKKGKSTFTGLIVAALIIAVAGFVVLGGGGGSGAFAVVKAEAGQVSIPVASVSDSKAHYFTYKAGGKDVNFFVLKSSDGRIRAALDACDVCYKEKKGYRQEGDFMVCNNCGQRFPSVKVNEIKGGCNPAGLNLQVNGDKVTIKSDDIAKGGWYF